MRTRACIFLAPVLYSAHLENNTSRGTGGWLQGKTVGGACRRSVMSSSGGLVPLYLQPPLDVTGEAATHSTKP